MEAKERFQRTFLIFGQEDKGYGAGREPSGYARIEVRGSKGKLFASVQNLKDEQGRFTYKLYIISVSGSRAFTVCAGNIPLSGGKGELVWEFNPENVGSSGVDIENFQVAAVVPEDASGKTQGLVCPLAGYKCGKVEWRQQAYGAIGPKASAAAGAGKKPAQAPSAQPQAQPSPLQALPKAPAATQTPPSPPFQAPQPQAQPSAQPQAQPSPLQALPKAPAATQTPPSPPFQAPQPQAPQPTPTQMQPGVHGTALPGATAPGMAPYNPAASPFGALPNTAPSGTEPAGGGLANEEPAYSAPVNAGPFGENAAEVNENAAEISENAAEAYENAVPEEENIFPATGAAENNAAGPVTGAAERNAAGPVQGMPEEEARAAGEGGELRAEGEIGELRTEGEDGELQAEDGERGTEESDMEAPAVRTEEESLPETGPYDYTSRYYPGLESKYVPGNRANAQTGAAGAQAEAMNAQAAAINSQAAAINSQAEAVNRQAMYENCILRNTPQCGLKPGYGGFNSCSACPLSNPAPFINDTLKPGTLPVNINRLVNELDRFFERDDPFRSRRRDYKWWKINSPANLNNILYQFGIKSPVLFSPAVMMAHFKYRHMIMGIYTSDTSGRELIVCGVPGVYNVDERPFGDMCRWVQLEGSKPRYGAFGYWLVYIEPDTGKILSFT